jgi:hypothetical protein
MVHHPYTEDQLVEQPAIGLFAALGWQTVSALEETFGAGGTLGRETKGVMRVSMRWPGKRTTKKPLDSKTSLTYSNPLQKSEREVKSYVRGN